MGNREALKVFERRNDLEIQSSGKNKMAGGWERNASKAQGGGILF